MKTSLFVKSAHLFLFLFILIVYPIQELPANSESNITFNIPTCNLTNENELPSFNFCSEAIEIAIGQTLNGNTSTGSIEGAPNFCGTALDQAPGIWYTFIGSGETLIASLCNSEFDTKIGVFSGNCDNLTCIAGNDDECSLQSRVVFNSSPNIRYYIYVTGYDNLRGNFHLTLDSCAIAQSISIQSVGYSHFSFSWDSSPGANQYQSRIRRLGNTEWIEGNWRSSPEALWGNAPPCTTYEIQVRNNCGFGDDFSETFLLTTLGCNDPYCFAYGNSFDYWIERVIFNEIDNNSGNDVSYANFTNQQTTVKRGEEYSISLKSETDESRSTVFWTVWIDFNQDEDFFDEGEQVLTETSFSSNTLNGEIRIPSDALIGETRMRVALGVNAFRDSCETAGFGDVEDYKIIIDGGSNLDFDLEVKNLTKPQSDCGLGLAEPISLELYNNGNRNIQTNVKLTYTINESITFSETIFLDIPSRADYFHIFSQPANLSNVQVYDIILLAEFSEDQNTANNEIHVQVEHFALPEVSIFGNEQICQGEIGILNVEGGLEYLWSNGLRFPSIYVSPQTTTTYYVTVTDQNGCQNYDSFTLEVVPLPPKPEIILPEGNQICPNGTLALKTDINHNIFWSNGQFGNEITISEPGHYSAVSIDPITGCQSQAASVFISQPRELKISFGGNGSICMDGSETLSVPGATSTQWSTGATSNSIEVSPAVTTKYRVTATDGNECVFIDEAEVKLIADDKIGLVSNMLPLDNSVNIPTPTTLSWTPAKNALSYDVYVWEEGRAEPTTPLYSNISNIQIKVFGLTIGTTYNWYIFSKNPCREGTRGPTQSFRIAELPDLTVADLQVPTEVFSGSEIEVRWKITNSGLASTKDSRWQDFAYLSNDEKLDFSDIFIGSRSSQLTLEPGQTYQSNQTFQLPPCISGEYYLIVQTDAYNVLPESDNSNNIKTSTRTVNISLSPRSDLRILSMVPPGVSNLMQEGETYEISWTVTNQGLDTTRTNGWYDRVFANRLPFDNPNTRIPLGFVYQNRTLPPQAGEKSTYTDTLSFTLPKGLTDTVYFYVLTDFSDLEEECLFEENNRSRTNATRIIPDLRPNFKLVKIQLPVQASNNEEVEMNWMILNQGIPFTGSISADLYVGDSPGSQNGNYLTSINLNGNFHTNQIVNGSTQVMIPDRVSGLKYLTLLLNPRNRIDEGKFFDFENENSDSISILTPNLTLANITLDKDTLIAGEALRVDWNVLNLGPGNLINRRIINDIRIQGINLKNTFRTSLTLQAGQSTKLSKLIDIPPSIFPGTYNLFIETNRGNLIYEAGQVEDNLRMSEAQITIQAPLKPDLYTDTIFSSTNNYVVGEKMKISYIVKNIGETSTKENWKDYIYLSLDPTFSLSSSQLLKIQNQAQVLGANEEYEETVLVNLPRNIEEGDYYLHLITDANNKIFEINETNNRNFGELITIQSLPSESYIDLKLENIISPEVIETGRPTRLSWGTRNTGNITTLANRWSDQLYLSKNPTFEPTEDILIKSWEHSGALRVGQAYTRFESFTLPNDLGEGSYFLILITDAEFLTLDNNLSNNAVVISSKGSSRPIVLMSQPKSDLKVSIEEAPETAIAGQPFRLTYTVTNKGEGIAYPKWLDKFVLSIDERLDPTDQTISNQVNGTQLIPGEGYQKQMSGFIPVSAEGNYLIVLGTDIQDNLSEHNEENNSVSKYLSVVSPPPGDLVVRKINTVPMAYINDTIEVKWELENIGLNPIAGYLEQTLYISNDTSWSIEDIEVGRWRGNADLGTGQSAHYSTEICLTDIVDGKYYIIVRTDVLDNIRENNDLNNEGFSITSLTINIPKLFLDTPEDFMLPLQKPKFFKLEVDESLVGETILLSLTSRDQEAVNELYVSYDQIPNRTIFDYSFDTPFEEDQSIILSEIKEGTYYIMSYSLSGQFSQPVNLLAEIVPFEINTINTNRGGNTGEVTTEIIGTRFSEGMKILLKRGEIEIFAAKIQVVNSVKVFATFDLRDLPFGFYDVLAISSDGSDESILENGFLIENGTAPKPGLSVACDFGRTTVSSFTALDDQNAGSPLELERIFPATARPNQMVTITFRYVNNGNINVNAPQILLSSLGGAPLSNRPNNFEDNELEINLKFLEEDGPLDILRPGGVAQVTVYTLAINELRFRLF